MAASIRTRVIVRETLMKALLVAGAVAYAILVFQQSITEANRRDYRERIRIIQNEYEVTEQADAVSGATHTEDAVGEVLGRVKREFENATLRPLIVNSDGETILEYEDMQREISGEEWNLTRDFPVRKRDEIGLLAEGFNDFLANLRTIINKIRSAERGLSEAGHTLSGDMETILRDVSTITANLQNVREMTSGAMRHSLDQTSSAVVEISGHIGHLGEEIEDQAASVTESSSSIEEMVSSIHSVTGNIERASEHLARLVSASREGQERLNDVGSRVREIAGKSEALSETNRIIIDIAGKTNLLAMNAAIEAAHAGASGRGFSVVADEIRKLAESTAEESQNIDAVLTSVSDLIGAVVCVSEQAQEAFAHVLSLIGEVQGLEDEARMAMIEQSNGTDEVLRALQRIQDVTASVREGSVEISARTQSTRERTQTLMQAGADVEHRVEAMSRGAGDIRSRVAAVREKTELNTRLIEDLVQETSRFRVNIESLLPEEESPAPADGVAVPAEGEVAAGAAVPATEEPAEGEIPGAAARAAAVPAGAATSVPPG